MCKFNNRLFVFALHCCLGLVCVLAKPLQGTSRSSVGSAEDLGALVALSALMNSHDEHYDQRQKGEENYRIKLDGFFIGLPQEDSTALLLFTDDMFENLDDDNLLAFGKNKHVATSSASSASSPLAQPQSTTTKANHSLSSNAEQFANDAPPLVVEIPAPKKYLEARHNVDAVPNTKSFILQFLNLLKRTPRH